MFFYSQPEIQEVSKSIRELGEQRYELDEQIRTLNSDKESKRLEIICK